ncbi:uncharacterized protein Axud1 isoform X2 [Panulirus ornatus]
MSEQETSRSPQSSTSEVVGASEEKAEHAVGGNGEDKAEPAQETPENQCSADLSSCASSDSGMGNTVFSSPEKCDNETNDRSDDNKESEGCDCIKLQNESEASKENCNEEVVEDKLPDTDGIRRDSEQCQTVESRTESNTDSPVTMQENVNTVKESVVISANVKQALHDKLERCKVDNRETVNDSIETVQRGEIIEKVGSEDKDEKCGAENDHDALCGNERNVDEDGGIYKGIDKNSLTEKYVEKELTLCSKHDEWKLIVGKKEEGTEVVVDNENEKSRHSVLYEKDHDVKVLSACENGRPDTKDTVDGELGDLDTIRDTDSEAGESCYSEDQEHGDACQNGCMHQDGICDTEQNWDCLIDEEFNVPRKPVFNGSTDQLERRSSLKRKASEEHEDATPSKCKRGIQFEGVTVFYFPRSQGFTCVPSQGGSSLGMSRRHSHIRQFSLAEHAVEQRRAHREYLMRLRQQRSARERRDSSSRGSSSEDSEENSEEASDLSDSELDADSYYFLQPLPIRQRRALLRQAGICRIEGLEKEECKDIRMSREMCGCQCKIYCDPDTCECYEAGIKCQVDRHNFPCGCSREGCGNRYGRIEFNPIRVRTHFIHTLMRLEIEKRQNNQQQDQQQQQWPSQPRVKWLATSSAPPNGFSNGSGLASGNLPFFEGGREPSGLAVSDVHKFNSSVEMASCVGSVNAPLYPHFESRQMLSPGAPPSVYIQHDSVGDYNSGTCSVFGGLGTTFDPSAPYGSCHSFPPSSVVPSQVVPTQVPPQVPPPQPTPEAYNPLSKFTNSTNLVSTSFPYSGAVAPAPLPAPVNCSYTQNNFCMPGVHENSTATVFGQYHEPGVATQSLFKTGVNECSDFQPNFEAVSSSSASPDKTSRYIPPATLVGPSKEICTEYSVVGTSSGCSGISEGSDKIDGSASNVSYSNAGTTQPERQLPTQIISMPPSSLNFDSSDLGSSNKDSVITNNTEDPTEASATENLGEIVKKSMVETVSA